MIYFCSERERERERERESAFCKRRKAVNSRFGCKYMYKENVHNSGEIRLDILTFFLLYRTNILFSLLIFVTYGIEMQFCFTLDQRVWPFYPFPGFNVTSIWVKIVNQPLYNKQIKIILKLNICYTRCNNFCVSIQQVRIN